ncbi:unnamed protein product, partial [Ectocarpus sp. 13 AM-2016]
AATTATPLPKNETNTTAPNTRSSATVGDVTGGGSASKAAGPVPAAAVPASAGTGGDYRLPDGRLGRLLGNEQLAHEILVNPDFQIPAIEEDDPRNSTASSSSSSPEEELARRFKDVMRRIFWDRFTQSLLPPPDPTAAAAATAASSADAPAGAASNTATAAAGVGGAAEAVVNVTGLPPLRAGSKVHARYGSERGSYYAATVVAVGSSHDA